MFSQLWTTFIDLIQAPFRESWMIWGIVPLYFALLLNELTSGKANFRTALQTGFSFVWAAAQWLYPYFTASRSTVVPTGWQVVLKINIFVSLVVMVLGVVALISGLRRRYPKYCSFLGHTRFSNYFMITIYPIQAHYLAWSWERLAAIALFAVPIWLVLHFGLMPLRR
ncbi:MAG TPA: hypothetical protein VJA21_17175 [Verrucomicrobiae bacterium]